MPALQQALEIGRVDVVMTKLVPAAGELPAEHAVADLVVGKA